MNLARIECFLNHGVVISAIGSLVIYGDSSRFWQFLARYDQPLTVLQR